MRVGTIPEGLRESEMEGRRGGRERRDEVKNTGDCIEENKSTSKEVRGVAS